MDSIEFLVNNLDRRLETLTAKHNQLEDNFHQEHHGVAFYQAIEGRPSSPKKKPRYKLSPSKVILKL